MKDTLSKITPIALAEDTHIKLSSAQRRLWFLYQMDEHKSQLNIVLNIALNGQVVVAAERLEEAFNKIIERHRVVRSRYQEGADGPQHWYPSISTVSINIHFENQIESVGFT